MRTSFVMLTGAAAVLCLSGAMAQSPSGLPLAQKGQPAPVAAAPAAANVANPTDLADAPGKDRLIASCSGCHDPRLVVGQHRDLAGWQELIDQMIARGAPVSDADHAIIAKYLAEHNGS